MDKATFERHLLEATECSVEFAKQFLTNELPSTYRYCIENFRSENTDTLENEKFETIRVFEAAEIVNLLWIDGAVPSWIDIYVCAIDSRYTYLYLYYSFGFTSDDKRLFHKRGGIPPFNCMALNMLSERQQAQKSNLSQQMFGLPDKLAELKIKDSNEILKSDGAFWILSSVIEGRYPLELLTDENIGMIYNRKEHNLSYPALFTTLLKLFEEGYLEAKEDTKEGLSEGFTPTKKQLEAALLPDAHYDLLYYGLTQKGGEAWESIANPDWTRYIDGSWGYDPHEGEIAGTNEKNVRQYYSWHPYIDHTIVIEESAKWEILSPWEATYWKTLPVGYKVSFDYLPEDEENRGYKETPKEVDDWFQFMRSWHNSY